MWSHSIILNDDRIYGKCIFSTYLLGSAPLKKALTVSVKAAATGSVSWAPMVRGLGPLEQPDSNASTHRCKRKHWIHTEVVGFFGQNKRTNQSQKPSALPNNTVWMKWAMTRLKKTTVMKLNMTTNINVSISAWKCLFISLCSLTAKLPGFTYNTS